MNNTAFLNALKLALATVAGAVVSNPAITGVKKPQWQAGVTVLASALLAALQHGRATSGE